MHLLFSNYMNVDGNVSFFSFSTEISTLLYTTVFGIVTRTVNTEILILEKYLEEAHTAISAQTAPLVSKRKRRWYTKKKKIPPYIGKFRRERLQSHI